MHPESRIRAALALLLVYDFAFDPADVRARLELGRRHARGVQHVGAAGHASHLQERG